MSDSGDDSSDFSLLTVILGSPMCRGALPCAGDLRVNIYLDLLISVFIAVISSWHTARIGSVHFTRSLVRIYNTIGLSDDVSGATLLAAATSFPVLVTSTMTTFIFVSNAAVVVIVGTCIYNLLVCVGLCAFSYGGLMKKITHVAFLRDVVFYIVAVAIFLVFLGDDRITVLKSKALIALNAVYITVAIVLHRRKDIAKAPESDCKIVHETSMVTNVTADSESHSVPQKKNRKYWDPLEFLIDLKFPQSCSHDWISALLSMVYLFFSHT